MQSFRYWVRAVRPLAVACLFLAASACTMNRDQVAGTFVKVEKPLPDIQAKVTSEIRSVTLQVPRNFTASLIHPHKVLLTWTDESDSEDGFRLERSIDGGRSYPFRELLKANVGFFEDLTVASNATYSYRLLAYNKTGVTIYSYAQVTIPDVPTLTAPVLTSLEAISTDRMKLVWIDTTGVETGFVIQRFSTESNDFEEVGRITSPNATTFTNVGLLAGTSYRYRVAAFNSDGLSPYSNELSAPTNLAPLQRPTELVASQITPAVVRLAWRDNSDNEDGFRLERSSDGGEHFTTLAVLPLDATPFDDATVEAGVTYHYRIHAFNAQQNSADSNTVSITVPLPQASLIPPSGLTGTAPTGVVVNLVWIDGNATETGHLLERSLNGQDFVPFPTLPANRVSYSDSTVVPSTQYFYRVRAFDASASTAFSNVFSITTPANGGGGGGGTDDDPPLPTAPSAPSGLGAQPISSREIALTWNDNSGDETSFLLERAKGADVFEALANVAAGATSYADVSASPSVTYRYRISAKNAVGTSALSNEATATTPADAVLPLAPENLTANVADATSIALAWADVSNLEEGFIVYRAENGGAYAEIARTAANATVFTDTSVPANTTFRYKLRSFNAAGQSVSYSNVATVTSPVGNGITLATPTDLRSMTTGSKVDFYWVDNSSGETAYVLRRVNSDTTVTDVNLAANSTHAAVSGLTKSATYLFSVIAIEGITESSPSDVVVVIGPDDGSGNPNGEPPSSGNPVTAPAGLTAIAISSSQINLAWTDTNATPNELGYRIEQSPNGASGWTVVSTAAANSTSSPVTGLAPGTSYFFRVAGTGPSADSPYSNIASATTIANKLNAPSSLIATATSGTNITVQWNDTNTNPEEWIYRLERSDNGGTSWNEITSTGQTTYIDAPPVYGATYKYRVTAVAQAPVTSSDPSAEASATLVYKRFAPTGVVADTIASSQITVQWNQTNWSPPQSGYRVERSLDNGANWSTVSASQAGNNYLDSGLTAGRRYDYRVTALGESLATHSDPSSPVNATTSSATPKLNAPVLTATKTAANAVTLNWTDTNSSPNESFFNVSFSLNGGEWTSLGGIAANSTSFTHSGMSVAGVYTYRVTAIGDGTVIGSDPSNVVGATIGVALLPPSNLTASAVDQNTINLTWTDTNALPRSNERIYMIESSTDGVSWVTAAQPGADVTSVTVNGLAQNTLYHFRIKARATSPDTDSPFSGQEGSAATMLKLNAAFGFTATPYSSTQIQLNWTDTNTSPNEASIVIERSLNGTTWSVYKTLAADTGWYPDTGLTPNTTYYYRMYMKAAAPTLDSSTSAELSATTLTLNAPTNLVANARAWDEVELSWTDTNVSPAERLYKIERSLDWNTWTVAGWPAANATTFLDTGLDADTVYHYRITALATAPQTDSAVSTAATVSTLSKLNAAFNFRAGTVTATSINLLFNDTNTSPNEAGVVVQRLISGAWVTRGTLPANSTTFTDTGLTAHTTYQYRMYVFGTPNTNTSSYSATLTLSTP